jgi:hypothetical protein
MLARGWRKGQSRARRSRSAFPITDKELRLIAALVRTAAPLPVPPPYPAELDALVEPLREQPDAERERRFLHAAHLIEATFAVAPRERHDAVRYVADRRVPIT